MRRSTVNSEVSTLPFFFFNDTATTEIYTLSLHDALPISPQQTVSLAGIADGDATQNQPLTVTATSSNPSVVPNPSVNYTSPRSEEHTSELQSRLHLVCRLLLEKKKTTIDSIQPPIHHART